MAHSILDHHHTPLRTTRIIISSRVGLSPQSLALTRAAQRTIHPCSTRCEGWLSL